MEVLYHFTSRHHLPLILKDGYLKLTESNLKQPSQEVIHKLQRGEANVKDLYRPVVWLTSSPNPDNMGLTGSSFNKSEIRFTLKKREHYEKWSTWSRENRIKDSWAESLKRGYDSDSWYVSESAVPITGDEIVRIENIVSGEVLIDIASGKRAYRCVVERARGIVPIPVYDDFIGRWGLQKGDTVDISL